SNKVHSLLRRPLAYEAHNGSAGLLGVHSAWKRKHTTNYREELAPPHSITSSARARTTDGMVMPSAFAALRLTTSSNFVGCSIERSAGSAPLRILSTKLADSR